MEAIEWMVLDVQDGKALLLSRYALDAIAYGNDGTVITWEGSSLRQWLNSDFLQTAFTAGEQSAILTVNVDNSKSQGCWDKDGGSDTQDKIFLLSYAEANRYFELNGESNTKARCVPTIYAQARNIYTMEYSFGTVCGWWLRSPGDYSSSEMCVLSNGSRGRNYVSSEDIGVRPAFWLNLESGIF